MNVRPKKRKPAITEIVDDLNKLMQDLNVNKTAREYNIAGLVSKLVMDYKSVLEREEAERPHFQVSITTLDKIDKKKRELRIKDDVYDDAFKIYELKKQRLESELATLHDQLIEAQGEAALSKMRTLVDMQMMHHKIQDQKNLIESSLDESYCCGCFAVFFSKKSDEVKRMELDLEKLIRERDALNSQDPEVFRRAFKGHIEEKRDLIRKELSELIEAPPVKDTDGLSSEIATMEASVEHFWNLHTHFMKPEAMLDSIAFYESLRHLRSEVLDKISQQEDKEGHDFYKKINVIKDKITRFVRQLRRKLNEFFCVDENDPDHSIVFDIYLKRFRVLPKGYQARLRKNPDMSDVAVPRVFEETVVGMRQNKLVV